MAIPEEVVEVGTEIIAVITKEVITREMIIDLMVTKVMVVVATTGIEKEVSREEEVHQEGAVEEVQEEVFPEEEVVGAVTGQELETEALGDQTLTSSRQHEHAT